MQVHGVPNLVTYFYISPEGEGAQRIFPPFIFEGVLLGIFTVIGIINFGARFFDAVTNPLIASWSDRSRSRMGRRKYFMAVSFAPFALFSVLVFFPLKHYAVIAGPAASWANTAWLSLTILAFYFFYVMYTAPYNALISELGHNLKERLFISTAIGVTWSLGFAVGSQVYRLKAAFEGASALSPSGAFQASQALFAAVSLVLMALPVLVIDEKRYVDSAVSDEPMFFGVRSFEINLGISVANIVFPSLLLLGKNVEHPFGIRMSAVVAVLFCIGGLVIILLYDEKAVLRSLAKKEKF